MTVNFTDLAYVTEGVPVEDIEGLHELVKECHDTVFSDNALYDVLLNGGYPPAHERAKSFLEIHNSIWNRSTILYSLVHAEYMRTIATRPHLAVFYRGKLIVTPDENWMKPVEAKTPEGFDFAGVERFQTDWMNDFELREAVSNYTDVLYNALDPLNMQLVLLLIGKAVDAFIPGELEKAFKKQSDLKERFIQKAFPVLSDGYYNRGMVFYRQAVRPYERLSCSSLGSMFILSTDEITELKEKDMRFYFNRLNAL